MADDLEFYRGLVDNLSDGVYFVDCDRNITYWNRGAEQLSGFVAADVIGRSCRSEMLNHVDDHGRPLCRDHCPLLATMNDGQSRETHLWMNHADGHRVPVHVRAMPMRDADGAISGAVEVFTDDTAAIDARARLATLEELALVDPLTGLGNRRYLTTQLTSRLDEWARYDWQFGILFVDIDFFKRVNDDFGHDVGDQALALVGRTLSGAITGDATATRYGGEEFVVVEPRTDIKVLIETAERLRALVESSRLVSNRRKVKLTVSIGGTMIAPGDSDDTMLRRADSYLYAAKQAGRNRVVVDPAA